VVGAGDELHSAGAAHQEPLEEVRSRRTGEPTARVEEEGADRALSSSLRIGSQIPRVTRMSVGPASPRDFSFVTELWGLS